MERKESTNSECEPTQQEFTAVMKQITDLVDPKQPKDILQQLKPLLQRYVRMYISSSNREDMFAYPTNLFRIFCEHDFLELLQQILTRYKKSEYYVLVIECLGLLSYNLRFDREIVFFLSRPELNDIIDSGNVTQSESVDVYIQFLKSLSMRLSTASYWKIFYNSKYSMFPLLWQAMRFYNHPDKLIRTTVRSIVLEVAKSTQQQQVKAFTVQAYLNNFPFAAFYAYEALFTYDSILVLLKSDPKKISQSLLDDIYDEITFMEDLCQELLPQTKIMLWNAFLYYIVKPLWILLVNQEHKDVQQSNFLLLALIFFSQIRDPVLYELLVEIFTSRFISGLVDSFFNRNTKKRELQSYSRSQTRKLDRALPQIQQHSRHNYNRMNTERYEHSESFGSMSEIGNKQKKKQRKSGSFFSKIPFLSGLDPDKWLQDQLAALSEGLGATFQMNMPTDALPVGNLYQNFLCVQPEQKATPYYRRTINPVFNKFQQFIDWDRRSFFMYMQIYLIALADPKNIQIQQQIMRNFMELLAVLLYELSRTKEQRCIVALLQVLKVVQRKGRIKDLINEDAQMKLLKLTKDLYQASLVHVQHRLFEEDWQLHIEAFLEVENKSIIDIDHNNYRIDITLLLTQPASSTARLEAMYFYMIRQVANILLQEQETPRLSSFTTMFNELKMRCEPKSWAPYIKEIVFRLDGKDCRLVPHFERFEVIRLQDSKVICEGCVSDCTAIKALENGEQLGFSLLQNSYNIQFSSKAHKDTWVQALLSLHRTTHQLQVQSLIQLIEASPF